MKERKCKKCGRMYRRPQCEFCAREARFNPDKYIHYFTPRIARDLHNLDIKVNEKELSYVRQGGGLYIVGATGCGKTLYAAAMMLESIRLTFIEQTPPSQHYFTTVPNLLDEIRQSYKDNTEHEILSKYYSNQFLVIDDLGIQKVTDWSLEKLYQIVNFRYENLSPTIFTSNLGGQRLAEMLGERIPSRIEQMCMVKKMEDVDKRLKNK